MAKKYEIYKDSPLVETIFEIRFNAELKIESNRDLFYEEIRDLYPKIFVPHAKPDKPLLLECYRFSNENEKNAIQFSINKLAIVSNEYNGFKGFKSESLRIINIFHKLYNIKQLNRTGLRYVNIIPITRGTENVDLHDYLNISFGFPSSITSEFQTLKMLFETKIKEGIIATRIETVKSQEGKEALLLDFDYSNVDNLDIKTIENHLSNSHNYTKKIFEDMISDKFKAVMRGEII